MYPPSHLFVIYPHYTKDNGNVPHSYVVDTPLHTSVCNLPPPPTNLAKEYNILKAFTVNSTRLGIPYTNEYREPHSLFTLPLPTPPQRQS